MQIALSVPCGVSILRYTLGTRRYLIRHDWGKQIGVNVAPFSERMGYIQVPQIQIESMDAALRNGLFNVARSFLLVGLGSSRGDVRAPYVKRFDATWSLYFKLPLHESPSTTYRSERNATDFVYKYFETAEWNQVYDLVEFLTAQSEGRLTHAFNRVLEREVAGYRVLDNIVVPISDAAQIDAIRAALETSSSDPLRGAHAHIATSLRLLSDRDDPDYRNSIKEAISAIESVSSVLTGVSKPKLKDTLRFLENTEALHPALRVAFEKLYGWTSDAGGVRHALMEDSKLDFADAQFMLVACSAFVHYLVTKAAK